MPVSPMGMGGGLAASALGRQGIPESTVAPTGPPTPEEVLSDIIKMIRGGQVGGEKFMELLAALAGATVPQMDQSQQPPQQPQAQQAQQAGPAGPPSIAALLGGR